MTNDLNSADWPFPPSGQPTYRPHGEQGASSSRSRRLAVGVGLFSAADSIASS